jgi:hypothetical protein
MSSVLTALGRSVCSSSSKLSLPCAKHLCHLNTESFSPYACLSIWNDSLADLPNFWQNVHLPDAQTATLSISSTRRQLPFTNVTNVTFFLNIPHAHNCFLLVQEKNGHNTLSWLRVSTVVHNSATMRPIQEIIDCTMYILMLQSHIEIDLYVNTATCLWLRD